MKSGNKDKTETINNLLKELLTKKQIIMINELSKQIHENAKNKGFFDAPKNIGEMLCLIH